MSEQNPEEPREPEQADAPSGQEGTAAAAGDEPSEHVGGELPARPLLMQTIDALLKSPTRVVAIIESGQFTPMLVGCMAIAAACHLAYGVIMGGFSGGVQWVASPVKLLLGTTLSMLLCYPSLYIFSCLAGADLRLGQAFSLMVSGVSLVGLLLVGFAPVAFIFTFSTEAVGFMGAIHLVIWGISVGFGVRFFQEGLRGLGGKNPGFIKLWSIVFVLTMLQMSTTLRPLIGSSDQLLTSEKQFFLGHWIETLQQR